MSQSSLGGLHTSNFTLCFSLQKRQDYPSTPAFALAIVSSVIADLPDSCLKSYTFFRPLITVPFSVKPPLVPLSLKPPFFPLSLVTAHFTPFRCMFCFLSTPLSGWKVKAGGVVFYFTHHWVCSQCLEHIQYIFVDSVLLIEYRDDIIQPSHLPQTKEA